MDEESRTCDAGGCGEAAYAYMQDAGALPFFMCDKHFEFAYVVTETIGNLPVTSAA